MGEKRFFGHPMGLSTIFFTEMWERFSYYGMRALLVLFLTASVTSGGFGLDREVAYTIYGIFTFLVYVTPMIGGVLADKVLGLRSTIYIGAISMAVGQFMLAFAAIANDNMALRELWFYSGLGLLIIGNGLFKPTISTIVGSLYENNDPRKEGGFTIFYMSVNIGAFFSPLIAGALGENVSWEWGYFVSGVGMVISVAWFIIKSESTLGSLGLPLKADSSRRALNLADWRVIALSTLGIIISVPLSIMVWGVVPGYLQSIIIYTVASVGGLYLVASIIRGVESREQWARVAVILILAFFNIFFWVGFEQAGTTFNMFALENTNRELFGWEIPASWFQSINAIFIVVLAPLFSMMWVALGRVKLNPKTPFKFMWGMLLLSLGAAVIAIADGISNGGDEIVKVSPMWLTMVYLIFTIGELFISPIGLSMITKLAPPKLISTLMGLWMFSFAAGNFGASQAERLSRSVEVAIGQPVNVFWFVSAITAIATLCLLILSPWLSRMMKGVN
ncbi:MAG: peptide MFS transporter [Rikenellaceae bacterium]